MSNDDGSSFFSSNQHKYLILNMMPSRFSQSLPDFRVRTDLIDEEELSSQIEREIQRLKIVLEGWRKIAIGLTLFLIVIVAMAMALGNFSLIVMIATVGIVLDGELLVALYAYLQTIADQFEATHYDLE